MNARQKLNAANVNGIVALATLIGILTQSAKITLIAAGILTLSAYVNGGIRGRKTNRSRLNK